MLSPYRDTPASVAPGYVTPISTPSHSMNAVSGTFPRQAPSQGDTKRGSVEKARSKVTVASQPRDFPTSSTR